MGCCISTCRPNKNTLELEEDHYNHVQDKLVISQAPPTPITHSNKISPSPPSPTSSTSSISSFTCTTSNTVSSSSSLSSASSALSSKDRSFSNEFLWSCYRENPHIIRINSLKETSLSLVPTKVQSRKIDPSPAKPILAPIKQSPPQKVTASLMPQKRVRSSSPANLTRQKSFRKEAERPISAYNLPSRTLMRSPSPRRRFSGDHKSASVLATSIIDNTLSKPMLGPKVNNAAHSHSHSGNSPLLRKENIKVASPNNSSRRVHSGLRHRDSCSYRIGSKIDETLVKEVVSDHDMDSASMEDIDNPLISLDCFIFL